MSIRHSILAALSADGILLMDELSEKTGEKNLKRLRDNVNMAITDKLVDRIRDETTRLPAYQITPAGRERLDQGVGSKGGEYGQRRAADPVVATGNSVLPVEAVAVTGLDADLGETIQEQDETEAIREISAAYMDAEGLDALGMFLGLKEVLHDALTLIDAWTTAASKFNASSPDTLAAIAWRPRKDLVGSHQGYVVSVNPSTEFTIFERESDARKEAEEAAISGKCDCTVLSLIDTARFHLEPVVKWGQA